MRTPTKINSRSIRDLESLQGDSNLCSVGALQEEFAVCLLIINLCMSFMHTWFNSEEVDFVGVIRDFKG